MATTRPCAATHHPAKQRLLELENEHRLEDADALKFTDEQRISLFLSFRSVKCEWSDLDGMRSMRWSYNSSRPASSPLPVGRSPYLHPQTQLHTGTRDPIHPPALPLSPHANAFILLTNAHLVSFGKDDTICVWRPPYSSPTSTHSTHAVAFPVSPHRYASATTPAPTYTSTLSPPTPPGMPPTVWSVLSLPAPGAHVADVWWEAEVEREGGEAESRERIVFPSPSPPPLLHRQCKRTPCPIRVSLPPLTSVDGDAPEEDDEDAWVDADDDDDDDDEGGDEDEWMTVVDDQDHAEDGNGEPPTPVPRRPELPAPQRGGGEEPQTPIPYSYEREATPTPYSEAEQEREREGEQVGGKRKW
ncbi:hypothetical protein B0H14DRAFT_3899264 [Mycena olivaceomarginata]|nr:hypothetical protein B0H14DRAFT_3899264 [Mycena olivaceomarginata]